MDRDVQEILLDELRLILSPLESAAFDEDQRRRLFSRLGWDLDAIDGLDIDALATALHEIYSGIADLVADPPEELGDVVRALVDLTRVFGGVRNIATAASSPGGDLPQQFAEIGAELIELLITDYLRQSHPRVYFTCVLLTLIKDPGDIDLATLPPPLIANDTAIMVPQARARLQLENLGKLLSDPVEHLREEYWQNDLATAADADASADRLFRRLEGLLSCIPGVRAVYGVSPDVVAAYGLDWGAYGNQLVPHILTTLYSVPTFSIDAASGATTATGDVSFGASFSLSSQDRENLGLVVSPFGAFALDIPVAGWHLLLQLAAATDGFAIGPTGFQLLLGGNAEVAGSFGLSKLASSTGEPSFLIGSATGTRLEISALKLLAQIAATPQHLDGGLEVAIGTSAIVIQASEGDGFLKKILPQEGMRIEFDLTVGWSNTKGLYFKGSAGLEATLPLHLNLFEVLKIESVYLAILAKGGSSGAPSIELALATSIGLSLGPLDANVDRIGLRAILTFPKNGGNLGAANVELAFKPPRSVGFVIDASAFVGGGFVFFDVEASQYGGILQIEVKGTFSIKAICLITTRMPDGSPGFSLLIIIAVEFSPIQLGYGFTLNGVGGLAGFNRTMKVDPLRDGIKNRTLDSIMFPPDPIKNAQRIISDLTAIFPPAPDRFVFAPMVKFGWGAGMLLIEIGLIVELPSPLRLAIMGKLHVKLPPLESGEGEESKNLVELHLDVLGILDFDRGEISVDAVLYNSRLVIFPITGGMAMRLRWGNNPIFLMAIGGLNPRFPLPPGFPTVDRLGINLSYDASGFKACLRLETYLAVTPNSLQFGARIDAYAEFAVARIGGFLGFDALIEFSPFHFIVDLYAGVVVQAFGFKFSVDLLLVFSGPGPFLGEGHATVEFLGKHEFPVRFVIGEEREEPPLPPVDPLPELVAALEDMRNWSAAVPNGDSMLLTMRQLAPDEMANKVLAHPLGELTVRQKVLPFGIALDLFGAAPPVSPGPYDVATVQVGSPAGVVPSADRALRDTFARGQYVAMSEDEKATSPGFETFRCGLTRLGADAVVYPEAAAQEAVFEYDVTVIDDKENPSSGRAAGTTVLTVDHFLRAAQFGAARQSPMTGTGSAKFAGPAKGIRVREVQYRVADRDGLMPSGGVFATYTEADATSQHTVGDWQVVDAYEVA